MKNGCTNSQAQMCTNDAQMHNCGACTNAQMRLYGRIVCVQCVRTFGSPRQLCIRARYALPRSLISVQGYRLESPPITRRQGLPALDPGTPTLSPPHDEANDEPTA